MLFAFDHEEGLSIIFILKAAGSFQFLLLVFDFNLLNL